MTLNERELFERLDKVSEILKDQEIEFSESDNQYYHAIYTTFVPEEIHFLNGAWMAWEAKDQAVQNTQVLIPKELPDELNDQIWDEYLTPLVFNGCDEIGYICCDDLDLEKLYQLIVKASESGAEG